MDEITGRAPSFRPRAAVRALVAVALSAMPSTGLATMTPAAPAIELTRQAAWSRADHRLRSTDEFRMASNSKTFVATLVLQQVAEHRLGLHDPVERWLPGQVPGGRAITLLTGDLLPAAQVRQLRTIVGVDAASRSAGMLGCGLREQVPGCACMIVSSHGRPGHLKRALAAGVRGFLPKTVSAEVLADVIRTAHRGGRYLDPELAAEAISAGDSPLTARETDVLELAASGTPVEDIARRASLSAGTVRNYLSSAVSELGAANRHEAVHVARTHDWI